MYLLYIYNIYYRDGIHHKVLSSGGFGWVIHDKKHDTSTKYSITQ